MPRGTGRLSRRGFLRLGAAAAAVPLAGRWLTWPAGSRADAGAPQRPNFLVVVFDTLSAAHLSLYGYRRRTTPFLERFARRATVFHHHTAAGNFTTPSTASLFTGVYPWEHRALHLYGSLTGEYLGKNLFTAFHPAYTTTVFTHNELVEVLFHQMRASLSRWTPAGALSLDSTARLAELKHDRNVAVWAEGIVRGRFEQPQSSFFLSDLLGAVERRRRDALAAAWRQEYPRGLPESVNYAFRLEDTMTWIPQELRATPAPFLAYLHLYPPHAPYAASREFVDRFDDGWAPEPKPEHFFSSGIPDAGQAVRRREYDEYIAQVDAAFGQLVDRLEVEGLLDHTYLILTSDHGEMFERGVFQHHTETMYQPLLHVPLLIAAPGQRSRKDVIQPTSTVDLLPTLTSLAGLPAPGWAQGRILPGVGADEADGEPPVFSLEAKYSSKWARLAQATAVARVGRYKVCQYIGYQGYRDEIEVYDLDSDPEERDNLAQARGGLATDLRLVLRDRLAGHVAADSLDD